jgi:LysR family glycine cleavage system transcriptional activator
LNALRAFEAAARYQSFLTAAAELSVTPGAIAQQIKSLEAWAQCALFERQANGVKLTAKGRALLPRLSAGFDLLGLAAQDLRRLSAPAECRIATLPSIAQLWLLPLMPKFRAAFPELTISISAMEEAPNLVREPFDMALFFDLPPREGLTSVSLTEAVCSPVCSPAMARRLKRPADLAGLPLLHDATWRNHWAAWFELAKVPHIDTARGAVFSLYSLAVEEAKNGAGVLIGRKPLVNDAIEAGSLVWPFDIAIERESRLRAATRPAPDASETKLIRWLKDHCRRFD